MNQSQCLVWTHVNTAWFAWSLCLFSLMRVLFVLHCVFVCLLFVFVCLLYFRKSPLVCAPVRVFVYIISGPRFPITMDPRSYDHSYDGSFDESLHFFERFQKLIVTWTLVHCSHDVVGLYRSTDTVLKRALYEGETQECCWIIYPTTYKLTINLY